MHPGRAIRNSAAVTDSSSLEGAVDRYLRHVSIERGLSANTVAAYRRDLAAYLRLLDARQVTTAEGISLADVSAFAQHLRIRSEKPLTASSMARMLSSVRSLHRFLLDEGLVDVDVAADVTPPKLASRLPKAITIEQMAAVLNAAAGDDLQSLRDRALLELLYATGARISEAVDLNVDDVIGTEGAAVDVVRLFGKGGKQRIVPLGSYAQAAIDAYLVRARPVLSTRGRSTPHCSSVFAASGSPGRTRGSSFAPGRSRRSSASRFHRTLSGTRSPRTCLRAARTCGWCRSYSVTHRSPRHRSIPW